MSQEAFASSFDEPISLLIGEGVARPPAAPGLLARVDQYDIQRLIGVGGMGVVYQARDANAKSVAIKFLGVELARHPGMVARFLDEASRLKNLRHDSIIQVITVSAAGDYPYYVMPFAENGNLAQQIRSSELISRQWTLLQARQIASALAYAHGEGIIHGDVKPSNVLLDGARKAILADFGLARSLRAPVKSTVLRHEGTANYSSPGLAAGQVEGVLGDVYAFGALLYEMLIGHPPYWQLPKAKLLDGILAGPPVRIREINPVAPAELERIAEKAMARAVEKRYPSMAAVLADLERQ